MRIRKSFVLWTTLICLGVSWYGESVLRRVAVAWNILRQTPAAEEVSIKQTYVLTDEWMTFPVAPRAVVLRVLSNATLWRPLPEPDYSRTRLGWRYSLEYQVLDHQHQALREATHHFRTKVQQFVSRTSPAAFTPAHFANPNLVPAGTRRLRLPLDNLAGQAAQVRIRVASRDPVIEDVVVRVSARVERLNYDDPTLWARLSNWRKQRICEAAIYPPELLSFQQRQSLLRWQWLPAAPLGLEGQDYSRRVMVSRDRMEGIELDSGYQPEGQLLHPGMRSVLRMPREAGELIVAVLPAPNDSESVNDALIDGHCCHIRRLDDEYQQLWSREIPLRAYRSQAPIPSQQAVTTLEVDGGWLEFAVTTSAAVRLWWRPRGSTGQPQPVEPPESLSKMYVCDERGLTFDLTHVQRRPTPLRMLTRQIVAGNGPGSHEGGVRWSFHDQQGQVLESGVIPLPDQPSLIDLAELPDPRERVTEPIELYWEAPHAARRLTVQAVGGRPLVNLASRPADGAKQTRVQTPGSDAFQLVEKPPLRTWFPIRPRRHRLFTKYQQVIHVRQRTRPPEMDQDVLAGRYAWEDFMPEGTWLGRSLLIPRERPEEVRDDALAGVFHQLPIDTATQIQVKSAFDQLVQLTLVVIQSAPTESPARVFFNDHLVAEITGPTQTAVAIPDVAPGLHEIKIEGSGSTKAMINHLESTGAPQYLRRVGVRVDDAPLTFPLTKRTAEPELFLLDYYYVDPPRQQQPVILRADLELSRPRQASPLQPLAAWKPTAHEFHLDPPETSLPRGYVLGTVDGRVAVGRRCFLWLGDNVPVGEHMLTVSSDPVEPAYILLSHVIAGETRLRKIIREHQGRLFETRNPNIQIRNKFE